MESDKFSKQSRKAIVTFSILFLIIVLSPRVYSYFQEPTKLSIQRMYLKDGKIVELIENKNWKNNKREKKQFQKRVYKAPPSKFDPNDYTIEEWMNLGLSEKQAQTVLHFNKFGFYSVKNMQKCFVFQNEDLMNVIKDSLVFPTKGEKRQHLKPFSLHVNLNKATVEELKQVKGIGEYFAAKIIAYRDVLGGYYDLQQLLEVYRLDAEMLEKIQPFLWIDNTEIIQIDLNKVDIKTLQAHPYIRNWNLANSIIKMREQKGRYHRIDEIKESKLMSDEIYKKIEPYLIIKE